MTQTRSSQQSNDGRGKEPEAGLQPLTVAEDSMLAIDTSVAPTYSHSSSEELIEEEAGILKQPLILIREAWTTGTK